MEITAKVICDSISPDGIRLTTLHLRYPRMIHSEMMTHRDFSRNGRSSRAVPVSVLLQEDPYVPYFMQNKPGMVAGDALMPDDLALAEEIWLEMVEACKVGVGKLNALKVHKQWANRPLEWFGYIDVLVSSTNWSNFFALRDEVGAQPEIDELAKQMKIAMAGSVPIKCLPGSWHLPYIDIGKDGPIARDYLEADWEKKTGEHRNAFPLDGPELGEAICSILKKISVARCARLTIKPFDGDSTIEAELKRYNLLMVSRPVHASPAEHIATPDTFSEDESMGADRGWDNPKEHANYYGWRQFRKQIPFNTIYDERN